MAAEEEETQRQRFYIELKPGETTIISWKKLLREAKENDQCGPRSTSSTVHETPRRALDGTYHGGLYNDSVIRNKRPKHVNRVPLSGFMQQSQQNKSRVELTKREGEKNDGHSSIKHAGQDNLSEKASAKISNLIDETVKGSRSPAMEKVKDYRPEELQTVTVDAPFLTYSKKSASFCSGSRCPPLNAVEDASVFPFKTMHNVQQNTQKFTPEKIKGVGGESSGVMHQKIQNFEGRCVPKNSPTSGILLHDKASSKSRRKESGGSCGFVDTISSGYKSSLKDSLAELWPEGVMDHHTLTEAITRAKIRREITDNNPGLNLVDKRNPNRISCQKRNVTDSSDNGNPIPSLPRKTAPKKATVEQPVLPIKSSYPLTKSVKLTVKQKQQVQEKPNVKVRFLLKQEHETLKSNEQAAKGTLDSRAAATLM